VSPDARAGRLAGRVALVTGAGRGFGRRPVLIAVVVGTAPAARDTQVIGGSIQSLHAASFDH